MLPRSLLVPPGIPEFLTRDRTVAAGECLLEGRAWSGLAPIERVEVSADGGATWGEAELEPAGEPLGLAGLALPLGRAARRARAVFSRARRGRQRAAARADVEPRRLLEQRRADGARHRHLSTSVKTTATNATTTAVITTRPPYVERRKTPSSFPCLALTIGAVGRQRASLSRGV